MIYSESTNNIIKMIQHIDYDYLLKNKSSNEKSGYAYERLIANVFREKGIYDLRKDKNFRFSREVIRKVRIDGEPNAAKLNMPDNSFKLAPFGERSPVDLIIRLNDEVVALECKSTTGGIPEWNDNPPKPKFLYAFNIQGFEPVFRMGSEIISYEKRNQLIDLATKVQMLGDLFNGKTDHDLHEVLNDIRNLYESGYRTNDFSFYVRRKFNQTKESFNRVMLVENMNAETS